MNGNRKSRLDEMQELTLLRIESRAYKLMLWGLLAAVVVQELAGVGMEALLGESLVMAAVCIYVAVSAARRGIWDRYLKPDLRTNVLLSLLGAAAVGAPMFVRTLWLYHAPAGSFAAAVFVMVPTFLLCLSALSAAAQYTTRRQRELEAEPEE